MNILMTTDLQDSLPLNIAQGLKSALAYLPGGEKARIEKPPSEGLFNHILLISTESERCVFRARRDVTAEAGDAYMQYMYEATGFIQNGGSFKLRNIAEEADFLKRALADGLPVPKLIHAEADWMLIEYVTGKTLLEFLEAGEVKFIVNIIQEMNLAHRRGIIYADRWGGNEMIDQQGNVRMIDFDIEWFYTGGNDGTLEALEMAWTIFNAMRITSHREALLNLVESQVVPSLKTWKYDFSKMKSFIAGLCKFYLDPNKPSNQWSLPKTLYVEMAEPGNRLVNMFSS
ncbi:hypothetical protein [Dolichospermum circinale]|uniref:hypothetical protein n=1 Tax=Dolichospermum circinale TaxID=109265 RepID=UPI0003FB3504|nr:hypothetical protein [Dolichospermum circinale]MDB9475035.1 hypothetical protein [Dolichospermum circinale CS-537/11]MDB9480067.1 hypothetical protein [Dolichospermum circinale CS-537/03]MDB9482230.1 hypothetical protein [Dolichospermum circinale CS-537/05]